ncbi:CDP-alcohol phosphatidyltransferase family protein [Nocardioides cheoyonin]|uniref:CDP-alcohol phosphatidyltransferase family protein n=1 Tax=Nocardioides cheoyonin TaxID=3156615 RepID=UPI003CCC59BB
MAGRVAGEVGDANTPGGTPAPSPERDRLVTLPNLLSVLRLLLIPVFLWLVLGPRHDLVALGVLVLSGVTDYLDGYLARRLHQFSRLGRLLDPVADRLCILAVVVALALRDVVPWWVAVLLPLRDVMIGALVPLLRTRGYTTLPVHFLGKAATFSLLYAFPLLLLGHGEGSGPLLAKVFGWSFAIWGIALYWWAGLLYVWQVRRLLATTPPLRQRSTAGSRPEVASKRGGRRE